MGKIIVRELIETDLPHLDAGDSPLVVAEAFLRSGYNILPVYENKTKFIGFVTVENLIKIFIPPYFSLIKRFDIPSDFGLAELTLLEMSSKLFVAYDIMTTKAITIDETDSILKALAIMLFEHKSELPVTRDKEFIGIIRASRIIYHLVSLSSKTANT